MAISRAKLLKRMADSAVVEARKKGILKKVTEKAEISKKDRNKFEALMAGERRARALKKKGIDPADAKKYEGMTAGKIAKKVENKARKESSAVAKKASKEARKNLGAGAIGAAGAGGALYSRSKIKEAEKESEKRRANNKPTFEFKQLKKEPIKKKAGGAIKAMKKIKDNAGSIAIIGAAGGGYPLSKKIQEEGRKAKAKNKKKGMKAGGIVDRQYLKGR